MKRTILITSALIILLQPGAMAKDPRSMNQDSLRAIVNNYDLPDTTRLRNATYFILTYDYVMPDSMVYYSRIFHEQSVKANYLYGIAYTTITEGWYYTMTGRKNEAMKFYLAAIKPAEECDDLRLLGFVYGEVGSGYHGLQMQDKAIEFLLRSIKIYQEIKLPDRAVGRMIMLAYVYSDSGNPPKAIEILLQAVAMADSLGVGIHAKSGALDKLGSIYKDSGDSISAVRAYTEALRLHQQANNRFFYRITLSNLANLFLYDTPNRLGKVVGDSRRSVDIALSYLRELESLARDMRDTAALAQCYAHMAKAFLTNGEKKEAIDYLAEAQKLNTNDLDLGHAIRYTTSLVEIYSSLGEYKMALEQSKNLLRLSDSLDRATMADKVSRLTESFEIEQMEGQLSLKEEQLAKNRVITILFIAITAFIFILAGIVSFFLRQKQKASKLLAQQNRDLEKARYRAEQSEKFKERFLASMSHEIRTPLNAVIGMTGLLLDDPQPPKTETFLRNIRQAGEHLTGIINQILDLSRMDAGRLELHDAPFSMKELMEEMGNLLGSNAREKELQLIIDKEEGTPDWFCGDAGRIRQVLLNLAGNAIKFTEQGSVQLKMTATEPSEGKAMVTFIVEDTGVGIPRELQAVIFEEFVQAGKSEDQRIIGTGLGLSIARKLVERMGGTLVLESEPGKGSVFSFTIPLELSTAGAYQALQKEKEMSVAAMKGAFRILVVEDNPSNQIVTEGILEKILPESKAILVEDGFKALAMLEKEKFDLVLMDIRMPGIDGYETTRRLRLLKNENAAIPVIALTASVIRSDIEHCLEAGMNGYVPKPVSRTYLAKVLHEQLKTIADRGVVSPEPAKENFLSAFSGRQAWSDRLYDICNGKKERFVRYLEIFLSQSEAEVGNWQVWTEQKQHEPLAFSVHKLLPYIRIFMDEKTAARAVELDQELRKGWTESHPDILLLLKKEILISRQEASDLLQVLDG
ncbi:MAG TPA: ATP-binding protein [Bacteroidales bacterium]|nr:ATP-binding protein [Bacteroidales bacterium]